MGRAGWFDEVMRYYDHYLKGIKPKVNDPAFAIEDSFGHWRAQPTWPVVRQATTVALQAGRYVDDGSGSNNRSAPRPGGSGGGWDMENAPDLPTTGAVAQRGPKPGTTADDGAYYTWSKPLNHETRVTGTPRVSLQTRGTGNVLVRLWDVAPDGQATMFDEQMSLVRGAKTRLDLKSTDWTLRRGHQLVVGIGTNTSFSWADSPSNQKITVKSASLALDLQNTRHDVPTQGGRSPYLNAYLDYYTNIWDAASRGTFTINVPQSRG